MKPVPGAALLFFAASVACGQDDPAAAGVPDRRKAVIEMPLKRSLVPPPEDRGMGMKVRWHDSFTAAVEAATTSGKPVLLFQLLGRLDDAFC